MATVLIAPTTARQSSVNVVVAAGTQVTLTLSNDVGQAIPWYANATIELQVTNGWVPAGALTGSQQVRVLDGEGTYRVTKDASNIPFGVESNP